MPGYLTRTSKTIVNEDIMQMKPYKLQIESGKTFVDLI